MFSCPSRGRSHIADWLPFDQHGLGMIGSGAFQSDCRRIRSYSSEIWVLAHRLLFVLFSAMPGAWHSAVNTDDDRRQVQESTLTAESSREERCRMGIGTILLIILILLLLGALPAWPHSRNWGYFPSGGLGLVVVILLILVLLGRI